MFEEANLFLYNMQVGDFYLRGREKIECVKRTKRRIHFSDGTLVHIKTVNIDGTECEYLSAKSRKLRNNYAVDGIGQILRDVDGYLLYKSLTQSSIFKEL